MTPAELIRDKRIVLAAGRSDPLPTVADHVAGERVHGNWWSHSKGGEIYRALGDLDRDPDVRTCRLVAGRVTFVHASLWPAVIRLGGDGARGREALRDLPAAAKRLHAAVEAAGASGLRTDAVAESVRAGRRHLERALLVQTDEIHTDSGKHAAVLFAWAHVGSERERRAAAALSLDEAADALVEALASSAGAPDAKALARWLPLACGEIDGAIARLSDSRRLSSERG